MVRLLLSCDDFEVTVQPCNVDTGYNNWAS